MAQPDFDDVSILQSDALIALVKGEAGWDVQYPSESGVPVKVTSPTGQKYAILVDGKVVRR